MDVGNLLQSLIGQAGQSNQDKMQQDSADAEKVHQELMANVAKKTITNNLQEHADNLMATNPDAIKILSTAIAVHQANQDSQNNSTQNNSMPASSSTNSSQNNNGYKTDNPVSSFFNMLGITPTPENQVLLTEAAANRQKIAAGQPSEIALPAAQAAQVTQQIQGLTPEQQAAAQGGYNSAIIQQQNDAAQRVQSQIDSYQKQYESLKSTIPATTVAALTLANKPIETPEMASIRNERIAPLQAKLFGINTASQGITLANPVNKSFSSVAEAIKAKIPKGSIVNINGVPHRAN